MDDGRVKKNSAKLSAAGTEGPPDWLGGIQAGYAVHNIVAPRPELPFWLVRWDGARGLEWIELTAAHKRWKPFQFEIFFGKEAVRDEYYLQAIAEAQGQDEPIVRELFGFCDLFYALPADPERRTFLLAGQFCRAQPDWEGLSTQWRQLSGLEPASANPDFVSFVRMALGLPVLEDALQRAVREYLKLWAAHLTGSDDADALAARMNDLNREYFSDLWPIDDWIDDVISADKFQLSPWYYEGKLTDWMKEGLGISRLPTTVLALMPVDSRTESLDPVQALVRNAQIQHACIGLARKMPDTAATRLQDYGVSIITSTEPGKGAARARIELRELAQEFQSLVKEKFHTRCFVGIGNTQSPGAPLHPSHREASLALHMCAQLEEDILFYEEHPSAQALRYADLQRAADALTDAFERGSNIETRLASDRFVQIVLSYSTERIEVARSQFLALLFQLFRRVERRHPLPTDARDSVANDLTGRLEQASSLYEVIDSFKEALQRLGLMASKPVHGPKVLRLEATLRYLRENFRESLRLPEVAKKAGFSVPVFTRAFKQATGTSFLAYVRSLRVEHAKRLLATSQMTTEEIAQVCGFQSQHHLLRSFKKVARQTPGAYRKSHAIEESS
jgi:AraC-like DNA-binding protein